MDGQWFVATAGKILIVCVLIGAWNLIKWAAGSLWRNLSDKEQTE